METPLLEIRDVKKYFPVKKVHGKEITVKAVDSIKPEDQSGRNRRPCRRIGLWKINVRKVHFKAS